MRRRMILSVLVVLALAASVGGGEVDDRVNHIIVHGEERRLSGTDRVAILRTRADNVRYTLISTNEECALKKFTKRIPVRRCEEIHRTICEDEYVLLRKPVKENCTEREEFCEAFYRTHNYRSETVFCQQEYKVECDDADSSNNSSSNSSYDNDGSSNAITNSSDVNDGFGRGYSSSSSSNNSSNNTEICLPKRMAVCKMVPQQVTLTERKQKCNGEPDYRTTKMCTTRPDGSGGCVTLTSPGDVCDSTDEMKVVSSELGKSQLECTSSKAKQQADRGDGDFCYDSSRCRLAENGTSCLRDSLPEKFELKEVVCEKCVEGRVKVRPVVETRPICRDKREDFCIDAVDKEVRWRKWCRPLARPVAPTTVVPAAGSNNNGRALVMIKRKKAKKPEPVEDEAAAKNRYHIELSPGRWVTTSDDGRAREFLREQSRLEEEYYDGGDHVDAVPAVPAPAVPTVDPFAEMMAKAEPSHLFHQDEEDEEPLSLPLKILPDDDEDEEENEVVEEEVEEEKEEEEEVPSVRSTFRNIFSKCLFNPRECRI